MFTAWIRSPMLRLFLPFAAGIFFSLRNVISLWIAPTLVFSLIPLLVWWVMKRRSINYKYRMAPGVLFILMMFLVGVIVHQLADSRLCKNHFVHHRNHDWIRLRLLDVPAEKEKSWKVVAEVSAVGDSLSYQYSCGRVLVYLEKCESAMHLMTDDVIVSRVKIQQLTAQMNPCAFDYSEYLVNHGVHGQCYLDSLSWMKLSSVHENSLTGFFRTIRERLLKRLQSHGIDKREENVLAALVLGKTTGLDAELLMSYSGAGAVHVLAVSGLHVALIYMILSPFMKKLYRGNRGRWVKTIVPALLLWMYAGITGFSPSVLRSALMFTCFIIADNFQKQNNIFNTMSVSAILLLIIEPAMITEAGFQLSYLAVLGIVIYQDPLVHLLYIKNKALLWAWKLTCVSTAAQLATLPITLYYFHQFPNYFVLTNLIVIPLSTIVLYVGLSYFLLCAVPWINHHLAHIAALLTRVMNDLMATMSAWSGSITSHIDITVLECLVITALVVFGTEWLLFRKRRMAIWTLLAVFLLLLSRQIELSHVNGQSEICFHHVKNGMCVSVIDKNRCQIICDESISADENKQKYFLNAYLDKLSIEHKSFLMPFDSANVAGVFDLHGLKLLVLNENNINTLEHFDFDLIYFGEDANRVYLPDTVMMSLKKSTIIIDEDYPLKKLRLFQDTFDHPKVFHLQEGAIILRFDDSAAGYNLKHFSVYYG
jgi:competence protein ComEC